jgi:hypothetical protein
MIYQRQNGVALPAFKKKLPKNRQFQKDGYQRTCQGLTQTACNCVWNYFIFPETSFFKKISSSPPSAL